MVSRLNSQTDKELFIEAKECIAGGVNSPVRSFKAVGGYPVFIKRGRGSRIYSEDGKEFIDYCQSFGALILGHANPNVAKELKKAIDKGTSFATPTKLETELAKLIIKAIPSIERIRLTNSGTEAVMTAIRLGRAYTGKNKIVKFEGSYHGHADYLLDSKGVPDDFTKYTIVSPYNNIEKVEELVDKHRKDIAAIIVEPVAANMGIVLPKDDFLVSLRELTQKYKIVLIFDEVITGFRLTYGGAQKLFGIEPDLTVLGKIIGGGLPIGALGGKREIMGLLAPDGPVYQAGTFSGNPVSVTAGLVTLKILSETNPYRKLEELTQNLCKGIKQTGEDYGFKINPVRNTNLSNMKNKISNGVKINFIGSMFSIFFTDKEVIDYNIARAQDTDLFKRFYHELLKEGIYLSPSAFEANFLSTAHTAQDLEKTLKAVERSLKNLRHTI